MQFRIKELPAVQVLIIEDHPIVRQGLRQLIETEPDFTVCGEAESVGEALDAIERCKPDVTLVDLDLKNSDGMDLIRQITAQWIGFRIIVVSTHLAAIYGPMALSAGAMDYVSKHEAVDQIIEAIHCVMDGKYFVGGKIGCSPLPFD